MAPETGQQIGSYELVEPLGSGGMGDVYRPRDTRLCRLGAIKFVSRTTGASADADARLEREARLASSLNHPGIVSVFDVGRHEDRPYVVMELVEGRSLGAQVSSRIPCRHLRVGYPCVFQIVGHTKSHDA